MHFLWEKVMQVHPSMFYFCSLDLLFGNSKLFAKLNQLIDHNPLSRDTAHKAHELFIAPDHFMIEGFDK